MDTTNKIIVMNEIIQLKRRVEELERFVKQLQASHSIPLPVDQAFRDRLKNIGGVRDGGNGGTVNENVFNSFNVNVPAVSGKRALIIDGVTYNFLYQ